MTVDIVMPTFNSNSALFPEVVSRIRNLKFHHFIVVDRYSSDGTVDVVKRILPEAVVIKSDLDLAMARKLGGLIADTDVVCFIDSDVLIPFYVIERFNMMLRFLYVNERVGALAFALCKDSNRVRGVKISRVIRGSDQVSLKEVFLRGFNRLTRGYTFFFCVRRALIESWGPPPYLSA
ncbi:MAG: glycosyltransferase family 2 protein [Infirmifilum sp.]